MPPKENILLLTSVGYDYISKPDGTHFIANNDDRNVYTIISNKVRVLPSRGQTCETHVVDLDNHRQVRKLAKLIAEERKIDRVIHLSELEVIPAALIREDLSVPGMKHQQALWFRDKYFMKERLSQAKAEVRLPRFATFSTKDEVLGFLEAHKKIVIKPRNGMGSINTFIVGTAAEVERVCAQENFSTEEYVCEQFIDGELIHVDSIVQNGKTIYFSASRYVTSTLGYLECTPLSSVTIQENPLLVRLEALLHHVLNAFDTGDSVSHMEVFHTPDDQLVFCEIANRPGGGGIVYAIEGIHGINLYEQFIKLQLDHTLDCPTGAANKLVAGWTVIFPRKPGRIKKISKEQDFDDDWVTYKKIFLREGDIAQPAKYSTGGSAVLSCKGRSSEEVRIRLKELETRFVFESE